MHSLTKSTIVFQIYCLSFILVLDKERQLCINHVVIYFMIFTHMTGTVATCVCRYHFTIRIEVSLRMIRACSFYLYERSFTYNRAVSLSLLYMTVLKVGLHILYYRYLKSVQLNDALPVKHFTIKNGLCPLHSF